MEENPTLAYLYKQSTEDLDYIMEFISDWMPFGYECPCHSLKYISIYEIVNQVY